jgi:hypothetical protein
VSIVSVTGLGVVATLLTVTTLIFVTYTQVALAGRVRALTSR